MTRDDVIKEVLNMRRFNYTLAPNEVFDKVLEALEAEPVKHGRWIRVNSDDSLWKCSVCGEKSCCKSAYCGDCGAIMDGRREDG